MFALRFADSPRTSRAFGAAACALALCAALYIVMSASCANVYAIPFLCGTKFVWPAALFMVTLPLTGGLLAKRPLAVLLCVYAALIPLDSLFGVAGSGATANRWLGIGASGLLLVVALRRPRAVRAPWPVAAWFAFVAYATCSAFWAIDPRLTAHELPTLFALAALFALLASVPLDEGDARALLAATIAGGILAGAVALWMLYESPQSFLLGRLYLSADLDPNQFAASLLLPLALGYLGGLHARSLPVRIALWIAVAFALIGIYLSGSRGAYTAVAAMLAYIIVRDRLRWHNVSIALGVTAILFGTPNSVVSRFLSDASGTGAGRKSIWDVARAAVGHNWLFGSGFANFPLAYDRAFFESYQLYFAGWHRAPHSLPISMAAELGAVGIALLITALAVQLRTLRAVVAGGPWFDMRVALETAFVGLIVASLFLDVMNRKAAWLTFAEMSLLAGVVRRTTLQGEQHARY